MRLKTNQGEIEPENKLDFHSAGSDGRGAAAQDDILKLVRRHVFHNTLRQVFDLSPMAPAEAGPACRDCATPGAGTVKHFRGRRFVPSTVRLESRRLLATSNFQPTWLGQSANMDLTGPSAAVGPDGFVDDEIQLTTANANPTIDSVQISLNGFTTPRWESAPDLDGYSNAEVIDVSGSSGKTYDVFFNPFGLSGPSLQTGLGQQLSVNVSYNDQSGNLYTDDLTVPVGYSDPTKTTTLSAPASITWNGFTASWTGQDTAQNGGKVQVAVSGLTHPILGAVLSDQFANNSYPSYWTFGTLASSSPPSGALYVTQTGATADIAFAPLDTETGVTLTLRLDFGSYGQQAAQFLGESCDPGLTVANTQNTSKTETPGTPNSDFLQADANTYGTIYLSTGTYYINQQLVLNQPVTICPAPGASATLVFSQPQSSTTPNVWSDAIEIKASHVTLQGFSIQFMGSFLWTTTGGSSTG